MCILQSSPWQEGGVCVLCISLEQNKKCGVTVSNRQSAIKMRQFYRVPYEREERQTRQGSYGDYRLKIPAARRRDWMGKTSTRETPRPTVKPMATETSCSAVWNPDRYTSEEDWPESCF